MNKILYTFAMITILTAMGLLITCIYWLIYPYKVIVIDDSVFPVINKIVKQGEILRFTSSNCKYMNVPSKTSRNFVNEIIYYVPQTTSNIRVGCNQITISVSIPENLPPATYYLHNIYEYKVNPIRTITVEKDTEKFEVK